MATDSPFRADVVRGKAALVTGGGSGICFEIAAQLARHGASVAIMGRRQEVLDKAVAALRAEGLRVRALPRLICSPFPCFHFGRPLA
jgi:peroxisomal 2,4-dienoyl-CoA reductase